MYLGEKMQVYVFSLKFKGDWCILPLSVVIPFFLALHLDISIRYIKIIVTKKSNEETSRNF